MPIAYERDDARRLITLTVTEPYDMEDIFGVIDRQMAEATWDYAALYDWRAVTRLPGGTEVHQAAVRVTTVGGGRVRGPVGIMAIGSDYSNAKELLVAGMQYGGLTRDLVQVEVLFTEAQLEDWMTRNVTRRA